MSLVLSRSVALLVLGVLAACLAVRVLDLVSLPALRGFDPYLRLYERETFVIEFYGRRWLPGYQSLIVSSYWLGWGLPAVRWASALLAAVYVSLAFAIGWRRFGIFFGFAWAAWLYVDADLVHVSATPYQEPLFFTFLGAALLFFGRLPATPRGRDLLLVSLALLGASVTRNEAVVLGFAMALALLLGRVRGRPPPWRSALAGAALLAGIPLLVNAAVVLAMGAEMGLPYGRFSRIGANFEHVVTYLRAPHVAPVAVLGAVGLLVCCVNRRLFERDVLGLNAFGLGFLALYLVWTPYMPPDSRRFHLQLTLWLSFNAAMALTAGLDALSRRVAVSRETLGRVAAVPAALALLAFLVVDTDGVVGEPRLGRLVAHADARAVGESLDAAIGDEATVVLPGSRTERYRKPGTKALRIFGYMRGSPSRLLFADDLAARGPAELTAVMRERDVRGVVLSPGVAEATAKALRSGLASAGGAVKQKRVRGYRLLYR
jgi:hypothetical protein